MRPPVVESALPVAHGAALEEIQWGVAPLRRKYLRFSYREDPTRADIWEDVRRKAQTLADQEHARLRISRQAVMVVNDHDSTRDEVPLRYRLAARYVREAIAQRIEEAAARALAEEIAAETALQAMPLGAPPEAALREENASALPAAGLTPQALPAPAPEVSSEAPADLPPRAPEVRAEAVAAQELWRALRAPLCARVGEQNYAIWLSPVTPGALVGRVLVLEVKNGYCEEYLEEHFLDVLREQLAPLRPGILPIFVRPRPAPEPPNPPPLPTPTPAPASAPPRSPTEEAWADLDRRLYETTNGGRSFLPWSREVVLTFAWLAHWRPRLARDPVGRLLLSAVELALAAGRRVKRPSGGASA